MFNSKVILQEGIDLLKATMADRQEVHGEYSSEVADTWKLIASVHLAQSESEKALRAFKKVRYYLVNSVYCNGNELYANYVFSFAHTSRAD